MWIKVALLCELFIYVSVSTALDLNNQRHANADFLIHEGGEILTAPKRDYMANGPKQDIVSTVVPNKNDNNAQFPVVGQGLKTSKLPISYSTAASNKPPTNGKRDYVTTSKPSHLQSNGNGKNDYDAQFPSLGKNSKSTTQQIITIAVSTNKPTNTGKRDYVAPQWTTSKPNQLQSNGNGKNDYDAQFPSLGKNSKGTTQQTTTLGVSTNKPTNTGKRDYVAPQFTSPKPKNSSPTPSTGKVKDLVNFFNKNDAPVTSSVQPTKPMSFSSIVGSNQGSSSTINNINSVTTPSVSTKGYTPKLPARTIRPGGQTVLPSSLNNKNNYDKNAVTDSELQSLSEELLRKDVNNAAKYVTVNYQGKTSGSSKDDKAPLPLFTISDSAWNIATIQKFVPLLDNYERDTTVNEHVTPQERNEENAFMDSIMATSVIRHLMLFLKDKGYVSPDPKQQRDFLKQLWFSLYARNRGKVGSSAFEHIFVSELKNGEVSGLHNWIYFSKEEAANRLNYLGYLNHVNFNDRGSVLKFHFTQQGLDKPVDTMFIGTSPELEIALYTLCFVTRADNDCKLKLGNKDVNIVTHTFRYRSKNLIGSAYPQVLSSYA